MRLILQYHGAFRTRIHPSAQYYGAHITRIHPSAGVRYVVDAGRAKQKLLEGQVGLARFEVRWVSKASAEQRAGRAGRTGPGHSYR